MKNIFIKRLRKIFIRPTYTYMSFDDKGDNSPPPPKNDGNADSSFSQAEVDARVEAARRDEKSKLYEELNGLRRSKETLSNDLKAKEAEIADAVKNLKESQTALADLQQKHDALVAAQKDDGSVDTEKLIKEITQRIRDEHDANQGKTNKELRDEIAKLREDKRASDLATYRNQKVQEAGNEIIAELVRGSSEEEIDQSVEAAKEAYRKYIVPAKGDDKTQQTNGNKEPPPPPSNSSGGGKPSSDDSLQSFRRSTNREAYAKDRSKILEQVRERFG